MMHNKESDTIHLLRECDAGIQMGITAIEEVIDYVKEDKFRQLLETCKDKHETLRKDLEKILKEHKEEGKDPNPMVRGMSWMKTKGKLAIDASDPTAADLITDGCNMGVKSLHRYLNQYQDAEEDVKDLAKRLINLEEKLSVDIRGYL